MVQFAGGTPSCPSVTSIPPAFEARVPGRLLKIEAVVRAAPESGLDEARMAYFTASNGASGWRPIAVTEVFAPAGFCFAVPAAAEPNAQEFLGLWPDLTGGARGLLLRELRVTIQPDGVSEAECEAAIGS